VQKSPNCAETVAASGGVTLSSGALLGNGAIRTEKCTDRTRESGYWSQCDQGEAKF
jgi:hypothetical protein